jgi:UDP-N-acetyl-D-galactosamine dehydrogenase
MAIAGKVCIVGLGYVGLPLGVALARKHDVIGFDINVRRVEELKAGTDRTREVTAEALAATRMQFSADPGVIRECPYVIVTVPTPIDEHKMPDLRPVVSATRTVGRHMRRGTTVVYESTVYPGVTEEECVPLLESESGLTWKEGFHVGYSPERVNPGDREHSVERITKVVAGDTHEVTAELAELYGAALNAGIHEAPSIKTAEAAKVIENTQRDLNIALMNELSLIFARMGLDTQEVLQAAGTKWNFVKFAPGLVGGHCIGVDPYYLTFKAKSLGIEPQVILAGRRINDEMGRYVAQTTVKKLIASGLAVKGARVLVMGLTFKEDISDIRNTRVVDLLQELREFGVDAVVHDPHAYPDEVREEYGIELVADVAAAAPYDAVVVAVRHRVFRDRHSLSDLLTLCTPARPVLVDIRGMYDRQEASKLGFSYWRL